MQFYRIGKKPSVKADLAIYSHVVDASGQCMSVSLILGFNLDFSSCDNLVGFCKSSHNYSMLYSIDYSPGTKSLHNEKEMDSSHVLSMHNKNKYMYTKVFAQRNID